MNIQNKRIAVIGGGAAGFFLAIELKRIAPEAKITIFERSRKCLSKIEISGGGRCNCTNSFANVKNLKDVYPRGDKLIKKLFNSFDYKDAYAWFENHGVALTTQDDDCVFPKSQNSKTIIDCFLKEANESGINIKTSSSLEDLQYIDDKFHLKFKDSESILTFDFVVMTIGGQPSQNGWLGKLEYLGHKIESPIPSLYSFIVKDNELRNLMGLVVEDVTVTLPRTKFRCSAPILITHWGLSGPAILKISSHAARFLNENDYHYPILVNWTNIVNSEEVEAIICELINIHSNKQICNVRPFNLQTRLWHYLLAKSNIDSSKKWSELGKKGFNKMINVLTNDEYLIDGRNMFKEEFVTCGGISLESINHNTLESKALPGLFFAGEILNIDAVTGGFNFQAAWTTGYAAARGIKSKM